MTDKTIDLDGRRGMEAQKATDLRRLLAEVEANERHPAPSPGRAGSAPRRCPGGELGGSRGEGPLCPGPLCGNADRRRHAPANPGRGSAGESGASRQRVVIRERDDRFKCPGCHGPVAWRIHGPAWRPTYDAGAHTAAPQWPIISGRSVRTDDDVAARGIVSRRRSSQMAARRHNAGSKCEANSRLISKGCQ
jgi:hypothetical protein